MIHFINLNNYFVINFKDIFHSILVLKSNLIFLKYLLIINFFHHLKFLIFQFIQLFDP